MLAPLAAERIAGKALRNWLEGLLPDDRDTLRKLRSRYGVSGADPLLLLGTSMGADCAGAAQFCPVEHADLLAGQLGGAKKVAPGEAAQARWAEQVASRAADAEAARRKTRAGAHPQGAVGTVQPAQALPLTQRQSARCAHYGVRSGKRCVRPPHRDSDHRYR